MGPRNDPMRILHVCNGLESAPKGVRGGTGSQLGGNAKIERDGSEHPYPAVMVCDLEGGERLRARDQGGGGYGSPLERETHQGAQRRGRALYHRGDGARDLWRRRHRQRG